ncbi:DUF1269 domain-containing protein [Streptomyces sp. A5-4]|uniref:DUF1269 domain-containing protein n=1 Tax=Streptomyces sp. A5-4 TaxID=3384771 RepID=UPI003DA99AB1
MAVFTVWKFDSPDAAERAETTLLSLQKEQLIRISDAAVVSWAEGENRPSTKQLNHRATTGALSGTFWGMLLGLIFFIPLLGAAIGAAAGALGGALTGVGIDDEFIERVKARVTPGTSALFLLCQDGVTDRVRQAFPDGHAELLHSNLDGEAEARLREVFTH